MASEHVAIESHGQGEQTQHQRDELEEPDDGNHHHGQARRSDGLNVAPATLGLDAVVVEVNEGDERQRPGVVQRARGGLEARHQADEVRNEDEEEKRGQEGNVLLIAMANGVFAHVATDEFVAILNQVDELVVRNEGELLRGGEHKNEHQREHDDHPQREGGHRTEYGLRLQGFLKLRNGIC